VGRRVTDAFVGILWMSYWRQVDGKEGAMGFLRIVVAVLFVAAGLAFPVAAAAQTPSVKG
jgi:hypothetical protein